MRTQLFDQGYFIPSAEGNLPMEPNSFIQSGVVHRGDYALSRPRIPRSSILSNQRNQAPTLNSFAAAYEDMQGSDGVQYGPDDTVPAGVTLTAITQPASVLGNNLRDAISGTIRSITPAAVNALTKKATPSQASLIQQYLQGKLPGYTLNPQTGQLQQASSPIIPIAIIGGAILLLTMMARR